MQTSEAGPSHTKNTHVHMSTSVELASPDHRRCLVLIITQLPVTHIPPNIFVTR